VVFSNDLKIDELKTENRYAVVLENLFSSQCILFYFNLTK
jgi:hypothetical protein